MFAHGRSPNRPFALAGEFSFGGFFDVMAATFKTAVDRSQQRALLRELDDRMLNDIGVSYAEALREADKPFWQA